MFIFDLQLFAQAPSAELITLGIGKEPSFGQATSPTVFLIPSSNALDGTNDLLQRPGARKRIGQTEALTGLFMGKGTFMVEADCDSLGALLLLVMGAEAIAPNAGNPVSTTNTVATTAGAATVFTPAAMTAIQVGSVLSVDTGANQENVTVASVTGTTFTISGSTSKSHATNVPIITSTLYVNTTLSNASVAGFGPATPAAMTNISVGQSLTIDTAANQETVIVRAVSATQFWAYFTKAHAAAATIVNATPVLASDHTFTLASPRLSFTSQANDVLMAKNAFGCKIDQLSFKLTPKQILEMNVGVEYQGEANVASPTSPTFSTLHGLIFNTPGAAVTFNGIPLDSSVQGISIDVNIGLIKDFPKLGAGRYRGQLPETQTKVKGSLDLAFESQTALQQFWGISGATGPQGDIVPANITVTLVAIDYVNPSVQYQLKIIVPMAKFQTAPITRKVGDYLKQVVQFETSESTNGAADDVKFVLTNASAVASF